MGGNRPGSGRPSQLSNPVHRAYRLEARHVAFLAKWGKERGGGATRALRDAIDLAESLHKAGSLERMIKKAHG